jgi:hypothetical protein
MPIAFRISRGTFPTGRFDAVREAFVASEAQLAPAVSALRGHRQSHAAIDRESGTIVYVSFWDDVEAALQLARLPQMQAAGEVLTTLGVRFERPVITYETLWGLSGSRHIA